MKHYLGMLACASALALVSTGALSASCTGTLTNSCVVSDSDGQFATEGAPNPLVDFRADNELGISELFFFSLGQTGAFTTTGDFDVAGNVQNPIKTEVTVSSGTAGHFNSLFLSFNGGIPQSIVTAGSYIFDLVAGISNTFSITGDAQPVFAGPTGYNITLSAVPIPPALALFSTAMAGIGLLGWKRRRDAKHTA